MACQKHGARAEPLVLPALTTDPPSLLLRDRTKAQSAQLHFVHLTFVMVAGKTRPAGQGEALDGCDAGTA